MSRPTILNLYRPSYEYDSIEDCIVAKVVGSYTHPPPLCSRGQSRFTKHRGRLWTGSLLTSANVLSHLDKCMSHLAEYVQSVTSALPVRFVKRKSDAIQT